MDLQIFVVLCIASFCKYSDAAITGWDVTGNRAVTLATDADSQTGASLAENHAVSTSTGTSAVATTDAASITYSIGAQTPATPANLMTVSAAGLISVGATALDRESYSQIIVEVVATDNGGAKGTATVTFAITGINDNTPAFGSANYVTNIRSGSCTGTAVGTYMATDADHAAPDNDLTHSIYSGNTDGLFTINADTGAVTVATGKTVRYDDHETFTLVLYGIDAGTTPGKLTGSTTIAVYVCGATSISLSLATLLVALLASLR